MSEILERVKYNFSESIQTKINAADALLPIISLASQKIVQCLLDGHKILSCGNGCSATDATHFTSQMLNRFKHERPGLPAISLSSDFSILTAIALDNNYNDVFAKQLRALGQSGDILLVFSAQGDAANLISVIKAAHDREMNVIALTGHDGGRISSLLKDNDVEIRVPAYDTPRIQETHILIVHCICDIIDYQLFGHGDVVT